MILLDRNVRIYRLSTVSGNHRQSLTTLTSSLEATIQPAGNEKGASFNGSHEKRFVIFMDAGQDVNDQDEIRDYAGNIYKPVAGGVQNRNDGFLADYMRIDCIKTN